MQRAFTDVYTKGSVTTPVCLHERIIAIFHCEINKHVDQNQKPFV